MARTFRTKRQAHAIADLNVTNLIDLGFTLLIIFMIATPLINQDQTIPVRLPVESKSKQRTPDMDETFIIVSVDAHGSYYLEKDLSPVPLEQFRARLKTYGLEKDPPTVRIRGDGRVTYDKMVSLMDELKKAGLTKITFDTQTNQ